MSSLERMARTRIEGLLNERGVQDPVLASKLLDLVWEVRAAQPESRAQWHHPSVQMVRRVTGFKVDDILIDEVIAKVGKHSEAELRACYREWRYRNYNAGALGWLEWLEAGIPARDGRRPKQDAAPSGRTFVEVS